MQVLILDYNWENSILDSICSLTFCPSHHSHTLAGITGNATELYITPPLSSVTGRPPFTIKLSLAFHSSSVDLRSSWIQFDLEEEPPSRRISLLCLMRFKSFSKNCIDQTETGNKSRVNKGKCKELKKKVLSMQVKTCLSQSTCTCVSMISWACVMPVQV